MRTPKSNSDVTPTPEISSETKRGRGRPRKDPIETVDSEVKRGRGRPRKEVDPTAATKPKRGRGRPKKEPVESVETGEKRGRGRPRKADAEAPSQPVAATKPAPANNTREPKSKPAPKSATPSASKDKAPLPLFGFRSGGTTPKPTASTQTDATETRKKTEQSERDRPKIERPDRDRKGRNDRSRRDRTVVSIPAELDAPPVDTPEVKITEVTHAELGIDESMPLPYFRTHSAKPSRVQAEREPRIDRESQTEREVRKGRQARDQRQKPLRTQPVAEIVPIESLIPDGIDLPIPSFRTRKGGENGRPKRALVTRTREEAKVEAPKPKPEPIKEPEPEPVVIPSNAPQVIMRDGVPTLVRDGEVLPPLFFFGNASDKDRLNIVLEEAKLAADSGVRVFAHYIEIEVQKDGNVDAAIKHASQLLRDTLKVVPAAEILFRAVFTAPAGWEQTYPKAKFIKESGGLSEPSICDAAFWADAETCLKNFITGIRADKEADAILGLHLDRGEWFHPREAGYDTSVSAQDAFRKWVRMRYGNNNVSLCAAWFDGQVQFETVAVPSINDEPRADEEFVQTGRNARRWVDYHLFLSDTIVDRITTLARVAKQASEGMFLIGASYGYTYEWSYPSNGHLSLGKLLRSPVIDFIAGPPSYKNREPGGSCPFPLPIDSVALNGKLYVSEEDFKTAISGKFEADDFNPVMKTPQALETVHWRGIGAATAHNAGVCWMDLWGNGWLKTPQIWGRGAKSVQALVRRMAAPVTDPDVAVFIDERSLAYLVDPKAFELLVQNVRESVLRSGLSVGFYLLSDLAHREEFPEAKVYVFTNAWDVRPEVRRAIKTRLQRDNKVLFWLYSAGLFDGGREALERVREITGIALKRQPFASKSGTVKVHRRDPLCEALPDSVLAAGSPLEPSYFAIPDNGLVLGEYSGSGLPSFVMKDFEGEGGGGRWKSVFLGEPMVTPALFRALGQMAGCHVWNYQEDVVHARPPFVSVHCSGNGQRILALPDKAQVYDLVRDEWLSTESSQLKFMASDGDTMNFLVGIRSEIEAVMNRPTLDLLKVAELPERIENTLRHEDIHFDVPIMRMDAWVEDSWSEEMEGDLMLKPSMFSEIETQVAESAPEGANELPKRGQRGRRRDSRQGNRNRTPKESKRGGVDLSEMTIVFRKRD